MISCPTCGRCEIDLINLAQSVEEKVKFIPEPIKIAVMGCVLMVLGSQGRGHRCSRGRGAGLLFRNGEIIKKVPQTQLIDELMAENL